MLVGENIANSFAPGCYHWDLEETNMSRTVAERSRQQINFARENFDFDNGYMILEKHSDYTDIYDFTSPKDNTAAKLFYINNIEILEHFIKYFHDKTSLLFKTANRRKLNIYGKILSPNYSNINRLTQISNFMKRTKVHKTVTWYK